MELPAERVFFSATDCNNSHPEPFCELHEVCLCETPKSDSVHIPQHCRRVADENFRPCGLRNDSNSCMELNQSETEIVHSVSSHSETRDSPQISGEMEAVDENESDVEPHFLYYRDIFHFITKRNFPCNATLTHKILLRKRAKNYCVRDGVLYYRTKRVIMTRKDQLSILERIHVEEKTGVHLGIKKMSQSISSKYFWKGQYFDIRKYIQQCDKCSEIIRPVITRESSQSPGLAEQLKQCIWKKVEANIHGPFQKGGENTYILTMVDPVSDFVYAKLLRSEKFVMELGCFIQESFCVYGFTMCYLGRTCRQYVEDVKQYLQEKNDSVMKVLRSLNLPSHPAIQDCVFALSDEAEGRCSWVQMLLDPFINSSVHFSEADLLLYVLKVNSKSSSGSPFLKMFGRAALSDTDADKENTDVNVFSVKSATYGASQRRHWRGSTLQCHDCDDSFTSEVACRNHQCKHIEEAIQRGALEGQAPGVTAHRGRRALRRTSLKTKHLVRKQCGSMQYEESSLQADIPDEKKAELRVNAVEAVRKLLAASKNCRKRRGKYKKFPSEIQEDIAQYARKYGCLKAMKHFTEKLGVPVSSSTIRNIVNWYQCFTPQVKEEIGRFAAAYGVQAAASHFSETLGREIRYGLIHKFRKLYFSLYPGLKIPKNKKESTSVSVRKPTYSEGVKETIGKYASEHSVQATISYFTEKKKVNLEEQIVHECRKMYQDKCRSAQKEGQEQQQQLQQQQPQQQPQQQQQQLQQEQLQQQQQHIQLLELQQEQPVHQRQPHHHHAPELHQHQGQPREPQQQTGSLNVISVPTTYHSQPSSTAALQETPCNPTIDILPTSLNLLNNPQVNNSTSIIYNNPYQEASSHVQPVPQFIPISQPQNSCVAFHTLNHCNGNSTGFSGSDGGSNHDIRDNIQTSVPLTYESQSVPISASVIINQNVTVQSYPTAQVYPAFAAPPQQISATSLPISGNNIPEDASREPVPLSQQSQSLNASHAALPTITVTVAHPQAEQHFHQPANPPAVVVSQPVASHPILVTRPAPGTTYLQHIIGAQTHLQGSQTHIPHQLIGGIHSAAPSQQAFPRILEHEYQGKLEAFSSTVPGNVSTLSFETPTPLYEECREVYQHQPSMDFGHQSRLKEVTSQSSNVSAGQTADAEETESTLEQPEQPQIPGTVHRESSVSSMTLPSVVSRNESSEDAGNEATNDSTSNCPSDEVNVIDSAEGISRKKISTLERKIYEKNGKPSGCKRKREPVSEQKRGTYAVYSPEIRAEMGKYAADYGSQRACVYFKTNFGYNVAESTMRGLRDQYLKKKICGGEIEEIKSLAYGARGRPLRLGQYDEVAQECIRDLAKTGVKVSSCLAIATARAVLMQHEPHLLEENGGDVKLNVTWAKSFLKRCGIKNYS